MTITETSPRIARNGGSGQKGDATALSDQIVLSGAGLASQGIRTALQLVDGALSAADILVLGTFDIAEQVAASSLVADLSVKGIKVARESWSTAMETYRQAIAGL